ncbi:MAG: hypothetical protein LPH20_12850, partial [Shewanella sp.]|nr:hypothetical protein [Shewanella sp.]
VEQLHHNRVALYKTTTKSCKNHLQRSTDPRDGGTGIDHAGVGALIYQQASACLEGEFRSAESAYGDEGQDGCRRDGYKLGQLVAANKKCAWY